MDIQLKRGTSGARATNSLILKDGQLFAETDTRTLYAKNGGGSLEELEPLYPANLYPHHIILRAQGQDYSSVPGEESDRRPLKGYPLVELDFWINLPHSSQHTFSFNVENTEAADYSSSLDEGGQQLSSTTKVQGYNLNKLLQSNSGRLRIYFKNRVQDPNPIELIIEDRSKIGLGINSGYQSPIGIITGATKNEVLYLKLSGSCWLPQVASETQIKLDLVSVDNTYLVVEQIIDTYSGLLRDISTDY